MWRVITASSLLVSLGFPFPATAQPARLVLACKGTAVQSSMPEAKPDVVSMGIIVDFTTKTVQGFGFPGFNDYPVVITSANDVLLVFDGKAHVMTSESSISGSIDRITGDVSATSLLTSDAGKVISQTDYSLQCIPSQRLF